MPALTLEMRVLARAAELLGGELALARELGVSQLDLDLWTSGVEKPWRTAFLGAVNVLIVHGDTGGLGELHSLAPGHSDGLPL